MKFYRVLSKYYDSIFPFDQTTFTFLLHNLPPQSRVLDIACGTGTYSIPLAEAGCAVTGIDADPSMIENAREKDTACKVKFIAAPMEKIEGIFPSSSFDGAFCIGNSLVHLTDLEYVEKFFEDTGTILKKGGKLIVQIINFDRILNKRLPGLPAINAPGIEFIRRYRASEEEELTGSEEKVIFDTELVVKQSEGAENRMHQEVQLLALRKESLVAAVETAGFQDVRLFGSFEGSPFNPEESVPLIFSATATR